MVSGGALFVQGTFAAGIVLVWLTRGFWKLIGRPQFEQPYKSKDKHSDKENDIAEEDIENGPKHSGLTYLSDDSNNSNKFYLCELDINGLLSMNEEKNNFDESVKQALGYYESEEGKQWLEHSNNDDITDPSSYIRQFNYGDANGHHPSHRYRRITGGIGGIGGDGGIALIGEKAAMAPGKGGIFGIGGSIGNGIQTIDEKMKINIHELMLGDNMSKSNVYQYDDDEVLLIMILVIHIFVVVNHNLCVHVCIQIKCLIMVHKIYYENVKKNKCKNTKIEIEIRKETKNSAQGWRFCFFFIFVFILQYKIQD